jgi:hypothetical protein
MTKWWHWLILSLVILAVLGILDKAMAHDNDWFRSLQLQNGGSCCNEVDCEWTDDWDFNGSTYRVRKGAVWHVVPPAALLAHGTGPKPERATVCWVGNNIRCFVPGTMS